MARAWESFEVHAKKGLHCMKGLLRIILVRAQGEEKSGRESFSLREYKVVVKRMLGEIWTIKAILMKSQREMRNILETGE